MPDIKLYDYQQGPVPEGTRAAVYWAPPKVQTTTIHSNAPWQDSPLLVGYYDIDKNLIGVRFVRKDGTYEDVAI
ncbi:hypothetical protein UFOVP274_52 [uncultured Caudovirales phage]|uniref:Uncharacterized protein n=1 Tax=uncultured Caudovirales phage TaxID=2100421 RepID=A0A6J5LJE1_9CAUD|nr:hypothetical protein UFOVP274_52 [uncultured Caudovirales phage]